MRQNHWIPNPKYLLDPPRFEIPTTHSHNSSIRHPRRLSTSGKNIEVVSSHRTSLNEFQIFQSGSPARASSDHAPAPAKIKNSSEQNIAKSVRASLAIYQNPWFVRNSSGILVLAIAVQMMMNNGIDASRVKSPSNTNAPQRISKNPTKCAVNEGCGNPILVNRSKPIFGSVNFRIPWLKKISPTARRTSRMLAIPCGGLKKNRNAEFMVVPQSVRCSRSTVGVRRVARSRNSRKNNLKNLATNQKTRRVPLAGLIHARVGLGSLFISNFPSRFSACCTP